MFGLAKFQLQYAQDWGAALGYSSDSEGPPLVRKKLYVETHSKRDNILEYSEQDFLIISDNFGPFVVRNCRGPWAISAEGDSSPAAVLSSVFETIQKLCHLLFVWSLVQKVAKFCLDRGTRVCPDNRTPVSGHQGHAEQILLGQVRCNGTL